jgi:phosphatidylserine decarboxylase
MTEFVVPDDGFANFNDFFVREIEPGVRPIAAPTAGSVKDHPGGTAVSCILLPDTHHWYHAPVAGRVATTSREPTTA